MFVFNVKINGSKLFKRFFVGIILILIIILVIVCVKVFSGANKSSKDNACIPYGVSKISAQNYTNVLKTVHEDIDSYLGQKINFTGYVYRVIDLNDNQFILARDMLINSKSQSVVVGFLCEYEEAKSLADGDWVEVTGEIFKGDYHGDMPIVKVTELKKVDKPTTDEFVYPPDESYIPTMNRI